MKVSSIKDLREAIGKRVKALREFSGIPKGTIGVVDEYYTIESSDRKGIIVRWKTSSWAEVRDGFSRDKAFDETEWLEVVD